LNLFFIFELIHSKRETHHGNFYFVDSDSNNKENDEAAYQSRRRRSTVVVNPYSQPLPFNQNERKALSAKNIPRSSSTMDRPSRLLNAKATASQINEESPTIKRILQASGCSSVEELLARDQQKTQANKTQANKATNGSKATNGAGAKSAATNGANSTAASGAKAATKGSKAAKNGAKSNANGSKSTSTNPKKKARSKYSFSCHS